MHNPCEECIVKVTCSEVCPEKENYTTLLRNALENLRGHWSQSKRIMLYRKLQAENHTDIINIYERKPYKLHPSISSLPIYGRIRFNYFEIKA